MNAPVGPIQIDPKPEGVSLKEAKTPWSQPNLVFLGRLNEMVQGGGKTGGNHDSDGQGFRKERGRG